MTPGAFLVECSCISCCCRLPSSPRVLAVRRVRGSVVAINNAILINNNGFPNPAGRHTFGNDENFYKYPSHLF